RKIKLHVSIFKNDYSTIEKPSAIFLSKYTENLFHALYNIKTNKKHVLFPDIEHIIEGDNIVSGLSDETTEWYNKNKKYMTWAKFDTANNIPLPIKESIRNTFNRKKE